jgi:hypothetical protein
MNPMLMEIRVKEIIPVVTTPIIRANAIFCFIEIKLKNVSYDFYFSKMTVMPCPPAAQTEMNPLPDPFS